MLARILKILFFGIIVRPLTLIGLGLNIVNREKLPKQGPVIIAANHNSHLDTLVLMSLFPLSKIHRVRPVAAADYFLSNKLLAWFALNLIGIIPLQRKGKFKREELFEGCNKALEQGDILILFPEGSRGKPEQMASLKRGIHIIATSRNDTKITPIVMHGLGRSLPRGEALFVPFNCDVVIGDIMKLESDPTVFLKSLSETFSSLLQHCISRDSTM